MNMSMQLTYCFSWSVPIGIQQEIYGKNFTRKVIAHPTAAKVKNKVIISSGAYLG